MKTIQSISKICGGTVSGHHSSGYCSAHVCAFDAHCTR